MKYLHAMTLAELTAMLADPAYKFFHGLVEFHIDQGFYKK